MLIVTPPLPPVLRDPAVPFPYAENSTPAPPIILCLQDSSLLPSECQRPTRTTAAGRLHRMSKRVPCSCTSSSPPVLIFSQIRTAPIASSLATAQSYSIFFPEHFVRFSSLPVSCSSSSRQSVALKDLLPVAASGLLLSRLSFPQQPPAILCVNGRRREEGSPFRRAT